MKNLSSLKSRAALGRFLRFGCAGLVLALGPVGVVLGQAPAWDLAQGSAGGFLATSASAVDANGNVFVTGYFAGTATFGSIRLTSAGNLDAFVAKWDAVAMTYTWATSSGGTGNDYGRGIAVRGSGVYVTGGFASGSGAVVAGQVLAGTGSSNLEVFVAKYLDTSTGRTPATSSFANAWATSGGGNDDDMGNSVAVNGNGVYVTGYFASNTAARIAGQTLPGARSIDMFVAKYVDTSTGNTPATSSFADGWAASGGGTGMDLGTSIAVSGVGVYVTGWFSTNSIANFAGQALAGAGGTDVFVAKYVDTSTGSTPATSSFANAWATSAGGNADDYGGGIAVRGANVYVTGSFTGNSSARVAGQGLIGAGMADVFVAKYVDTSTGGTPATSSFANAWATSAGGTGDDIGNSIAVNGPDVYVTGNFSGGSNARIAGQALAGTGGLDVFVAKYTDTSTGGTPATSSFVNGWATDGGGMSDDRGNGIVVSGSWAYVVGMVATPATFGSFTLNSGARGDFLARLPTTFVSSTRPGSSPSALTLAPNPARAALTVGGAPAGAAVAVFDALGRPVATAPADATGTARLRLPAGLAAGVYVVRAGAQTARLAVE